MPSPTTGTSSLQYLSAIAPQWLDVDYDPNIMAVRRNREFLDIIKGMGGILKMAMDDKKETIYNGFYENVLNQPINTTGATITGNGTIATPFAVSVVPADSQGVVAVGDNLMLASGKLVRVMTVPTAASFTAVTVDGTSTTWTAGQYATNVTQSSSSGSNAPTPKRWGVSQLSNVIQIIRSTTEITDVATVSALRTKVGGQYYYTPYESMQLATAHYGKIMGAIMQGQLGSTLFTDASPALNDPASGSRGIQNTRGLEQYITSFGVNDPVTTLGTVTLGDVADFLNLLVGARSPKDYLVVSSTAIQIAYSNLLKGLASSGAIQSLRLNVDGRSTDFETDNFMYGGFNIRLKSLGYLDNAEMVGSSSTTLMTAGKKAFWIPMGQSPTVGGPAQPYIKIAHLPEPRTTGGNRTMTEDGLVVETKYGGIAPTATSGLRTETIDLTSMVGLWLSDPQAFGAQTVLA